MIMVPGVTPDGRKGKFRFPGQHDEEHIVLLLRAHWIVIFWHFVGVFLLTLLPVVAIAVIERFFVDFLSSVYFPWFVLWVSAHYLFTIMLAYIGWIDYYLDVWIVTNERIVNIIQAGLFRRTVSEQNIYRVQDVTSRVKGVLETFFNYGDVVVQTAGAKNQFSFNKVPNPYEVRKIIIKIHNFQVEQMRKRGIDPYSIDGVGDMAAGAGEGYEDGYDGSGEGSES